MITINKNIQEQAKDKELAQDILIAELRTNYDSIKTENIKLNDSLDTQHKLCKLWLEKMEVKEDATVPENKANEKSSNDNEVEVEEEVEEEVEIIENEDEEEVDTEEIFQQFIRNKERGFKRTYPTTSAAQNKSGDIKCETCGYIANNKNTLNDHIIRVHKITRRTDKRTEVREVKEQKKILYCHYWNNGGSCNFEERTGRQCKFEHKEAPRCKFDGQCNRKACMFSHKNPRMDFLGNRTRGVRPPPQEPLEILMNALGLQRMQGHGQLRRECQRRF